MRRWLIAALVLLVLPLSAVRLNVIGAGNKTYGVLVNDFDDDGDIDGVDVQAAIDSCPTGFGAGSGGCDVVLPSGVIDVSAPINIGGGTSGTTMNGLTLRGQGRTFVNAAGLGGGTILRWNGDGVTTPQAVIDIDAGYMVSVRDLTIKMDQDDILDSTLDYAAWGIRIVADNAGSVTNQQIELKRLFITGPLTNGTIFQKTFATSDVNTAGDYITEAAHGFTAGDGPMVFVVGPGGVLPTATPTLETYGTNSTFADLQSYWVAPDASDVTNRFAVYTTRADALADTNRVNFTAVPTSTDNVIDVRGSVSIYVTADSLVGQSDKMVFEDIWTRLDRVSLWSEGLQIQASRIIGGQWYPYHVMHYNIGGEFTWMPGTLVGCFMRNCKVFQFASASGGAVQAVRAQMDGIYYESDTTSANETFLWLGPAFDSTAAASPISVPVRVVNSYLNSQGTDSVHLIHGMTNADVTLEGNFLYVTTDPQNSFTIRVGNSTGQVFSDVDVSNNIYRPFDHGLGTTFSDIRTSGHLKLILPKHEQADIDPADLNEGFADHGRCINTGGHGSNILVGDGFEESAALGTASTPTAQAWASTSLLTRTPKIRYTTTAAADQDVEISPINASSTRLLSYWVGDTANIDGGFVWYGKAALADVHSASRFAAGMFGTTDFTASSDPSATANSANSLYFGCDAAGTNVQVCANDNTTASTCTDLGTDYPCHTDNAFYEMWIYARKGAGSAAPGTYSYRIKRLDSNVADSMGFFPTGAGTPQNSVSLGPAIVLGSGTAATAVSLDFVQMCVWGEH